MYKDQNNKCILKNQDNFLDLKDGNYILHIYSMGPHECSRSLVIYSSDKVCLYYRKEHEFQVVKHIMIRNVYKKTQHSLETAL